MQYNIKDVFGTEPISGEKYNLTDMLIFLSSKFPQKNVRGQTILRQQKKISDSLLQKDINKESC